MAKDWLDKLKDFAQILSLVAIPLVVAWVGSAIQSAVKEREIRRDYVQIAIGILGAKETTPALRSWAVQVLELNSPVPLSLGAQAALTSGGADVVDAFRSQLADDNLARLIREYAQAQNLKSSSEPMVREPSPLYGNKSDEPMVKGLSGDGMSQAK